MNFTELRVHVSCWYFCWQCNGHEKSSDNLGEIVDNGGEFAKALIDSTFESIYHTKQVIADLRKVGYNDATDTVQAK